MGEAELIGASLNHFQPVEHPKLRACQCCVSRKLTAWLKKFFFWVVFMSMTKTRCTDRVVGAILASWRYDISGIPPEMRRDYEQHFAECAHCSARQKFHRSLDGTLAVLTSLAALFFLFALAVLKHIKPLEHMAFKVLGLDVADTYHMLFSAGIAGLAF